ncbi:hypothetical protein [Thalassomonas actiniarum]|uniref:Uncharacterized protein n=1 Tax=Thalassomonas actiniarum TaxID=485447 RepID=A0AAE9YWH4_9GAMM|nr:hypothetical protein [Thalassomonas actiniarum]WDE02148.1 hypothetical protein SG35_030790 [Thalassomonas actiniarum]
MNKLLNMVFIAVLSTVSVSSALASQPSTKGQLTLSFSDGRADVNGVEAVNQHLLKVGVRVSTLPLPEAAKPILKASTKRAVTQEESEKLLSLFSLHRGQLLDEIAKAGRKPEAHRGGYLSTSELGVAPYPKVYDMNAMTTEIKHYLQKKFGKLHVNSSNAGVGIDEVMTIVSGGSWTWFFVLPDNVVGKLTLGYVGLDSKAWRISYPGLVPHGGYLDSDYGLVVAYAHGPKNFVMRYEEPSVEGTETLNDNPWIDFSGDKPKLLKMAK